jgi:hypothetical protein
MSSEPDCNQESDEINRQDGLEPYWLFFNGEWAETICGLAAAVAAVFWCFLYVLGYSKTTLGYVLAALAVIGFIGWNVIQRAIRDYEGKGWRKHRRSSGSRDKKKL